MEMPSDHLGMPGTTSAQVRDRAADTWRTLVIGLTAFLTLVDLFATQAILPTLADFYLVSAAAMGLAVNACTVGMAVSCLVVAVFGRCIDRRLGSLASLALLSVPTLLLASAPDLVTFAMLRILQGVFMAAAFTLTLAYLAEQCSARIAAGAFAAYITGNVASNLFGRMLSAGIADNFGLAANFQIFSLLNLAGAILVFVTMKRGSPVSPAGINPHPVLTRWAEHLGSDGLRAAFLIGFCILFGFIGTFTYVNFVLVDAPISLSMMNVGLVYLVFLPAVVTTLMAGWTVDRLGVRHTTRAALGLALAGLPLLLIGNVPGILAGLMLVGIGTFFAQGVATGFVGRAATSDRAGASGLYLASYFSGGLVGSAVLGLLFDVFGWPACVAGIAIAFLGATAVAGRLDRKPVAGT